jgi:hypothetical protein
MTYRRKGMAPHELAETLEKAIAAQRRQLAGRDSTAAR